MQIEICACVLVLFSCINIIFWETGDWMRLETETKKNDRKETNDIEKSRDRPGGYIYYYYYYLYIYIIMGCGQTNGMLI